MQQLPSSYRDIDGFVFSEEGRILRFIDPRYSSTYGHLLESGLYDELVSKAWLVPHVPVPGHPLTTEKGGIVICPQQIPFISYPYEWSFDMLKDAALLTLDIAIASIAKGMSLKDATPFNIQFVQGKLLFIDTLSFEMYDETQPWIAYRQFCESFLGPLLLMHYNHPELSRLLTLYPDGIPLDVLVTLLPERSAWNLNAYLHIYLQAKMGKKKNNKTSLVQHFSRRKMEVLLNGLKGFTGKLSPRQVKTTWDDYYSDTILGKDYLQAKTTLVQQLLEGVNLSTAIDLGANDGHFSMLLKDKCELIIATDADTNCINQLYRNTRTTKTNIIPLVTDLLNPSPAIGWNNKERTAIGERLRADLVMALALVHHLAIGRNVPLSWIADWLTPMAPWLLIEFVPKEDEKVQLLLRHRKDVFENYDLRNFKEAFEKNYEIRNEAKVGNTQRTLFLMQRRR